MVYCVESPFLNTDFPRGWLSFIVLFIILLGSLIRTLQTNLHSCILNNKLMGDNCTVFVRFPVHAAVLLLHCTTIQGAPLGVCRAKTNGQICSETHIHQYTILSWAFLDSYYIRQGLLCYYFWYCTTLIYTHGTVIFEVYSSSLNLQPFSPFYSCIQ